MVTKWVLLLRCRGGRGRHAFVFARHVNNFGTMAFHVFQAIPFLYELRELLDWSCTATSLTLFDWLKLEDISISLFFVTVSRQNRQRHRLGERQPRYTKFFQVCTKNICMPFGCMTISPIGPVASVSSSVQQYHHVFTFQQCFGCIP